MAKSKDLANSTKKIETVGNQQGQIRTAHW